MSRALVAIAYASLIACGAIALGGGPSPTLARQGGGVITLVWSSLCVLAGLVGMFGALRSSRLGEVLGALFGASASVAWTASLILQGITNGTWGTASAACMGAALTALFVYQARRLGRGDGV